ncbi:MAG: HAMP domain-containing sensor histidine kinase [Acidobacteriota bacterium]
MSLDFEELLEVNRLRIVARVVSNAAHDINNALQVIGGSAEMLGLRSTLGPTEQRRVQAIASQAERIAATLEGLSSITRSDGGGRQMVDLIRLADDAVALRAFSLSRARITVTVDRPSGVSCVVPADRRRLLQLFLNLLLNVEVALAGRPDSALHIRFERSDREWSVLFVDSGPGLGADERARLADGATRPVLGPGLSGFGLWLSARIAEQHGGHLDVDDAAVGTTMRIRLPASV